MAPCTNHSGDKSDRRFEYVRPEKTERRQSCGAWWPCPASGRSNTFLFSDVSKASHFLATPSVVPSNDTGEESETAGTASPSGKVLMRSPKMEPC